MSILKVCWYQGCLHQLQSVGLDNLGTNKLQSSANDKKTWKQKTDEVLRGRRALDSVSPYNHHIDVECVTKIVRQVFFLSPVICEFIIIGV